MDQSTGRKAPRRCRDRRPSRALTATMPRVGASQENLNISRSTLNQQIPDHAGNPFRIEGVLWISREHLPNSQSASGPRAGTEAAVLYLASNRRHGLRAFGRGAGLEVQEESRELIGARLILPRGGLLRSFELLAEIRSNCRNPELLF